MQRIAIFASGTGTNAKKLIEHFQDHKGARVDLVLTNNPKAGVIDIAKFLGVPVMVIDREQFYGSGEVLGQLKQKQIDFIVLAGFLWLIPKNLIETYPNKIINIHPALLPKFGGKGMYGSNVHKAVLAAAEKETGITIHYVNEKYDEGQVVFQAKCPVTLDDTPEAVAKKVQKLEHEFFPKVIERVISQG